MHRLPWAEVARMTGLERFKGEWGALGPYERFERLVTAFLIGFIAIIIVVSAAIMVIEVVADLMIGMGFLETEALQDAFGSILTVVILLEFNHSIALSTRTRTGVIQVRVVVLIAILAIARKLILLDYKAAGSEVLLGMGGLVLALGILYWLIAEADRRRRQPEPPPPPRRIAAQD
jgi:uncharacterized membrane protein (DUF373 family)